MVLGDRVSERTVEQFRAAGQQQGFVDISGRRRMRNEVELVIRTKNWNSRL